MVPTDEKDINAAYEVRYSLCRVFEVELISLRAGRDGRAGAEGDEGDQGRGSRDSDDGQLRYHSDQRAFILLVQHEEFD